MRDMASLLENFGFTPSAVTAFAQLTYIQILLHSAGDPVFKLTPELVTLLRDTDLPEDVEGVWLRLPFEAITLEVPPGTFAGKSQSITKLHCARLDGERFRVVFPNDAEGTTNYISLDMSDENKKIAQLVEEAKARAFEGMSPVDAAEIKSQWAYEDYFKSDVFTLAVNAALYITSAGADVQLDDWPIKTASGRLAEAKMAGVTSRRRLESLEKNVEAAKAHPIYIVGGGLKFGAEDIDGARLTDEGKRAVRKHRVRGFWRKQPFGKEAAERKTIWIKPYWRGMSYAEMLERNYVVK